MLKDVLTHFNQMSEFEIASLPRNDSICNRFWVSHVKNRIKSFIGCTAMTQTQIAVSLYEQDYLLWIEDTVDKLRNKDIEGLDFENLIEEMEDLGKSDKRELENRLQELLEHILKRHYVNMNDCYRGWVESIIKQRIGIRKLLKSSPSLKPYFHQVFNEAYTDALKIVRNGYPQCEFPEMWPFSREIEAVLNVDFWEE